MASGSHRLALDDAAKSLGVSVDILKKRFSAGELPEATDDGDEITVGVDDLAAIADRENWIIDLRTRPGEQGREFSEMLEHLLSLGDRLAEEVSARKVAQAQLAHAELDIRRLTDTIEEQEAENQRLALDLRETVNELTAARATAEERRQSVIQLTNRNNELRAQHQRELSDHRFHASSLRDELTRAHAAMGWWSRRRLTR